MKLLNVGAGFVVGVLLGLAAIVGWWVWEGYREEVNNNASTM